VIHVSSQVSEANIEESKDKILAAVDEAVRRKKAQRAS
jgi:hypothetical protein